MLSFDNKLISSFIDSDQLYMTGWSNYVTSHLQYQTLEQGLNSLELVVGYHILYSNLHHTVHDHRSEVKFTRIFFYKWTYFGMGIPAVSQVVWVSCHLWLVAWMWRTSCFFPSAFLVEGVLSSSGSVCLGGWLHHLMGEGGISGSLKMVATYGHRAFSLKC